MNTVRIQAAEYHEQAVTFLRGNPLIEALPEIISEEDFYAQAEQKPKVERDEALKCNEAVRADYTTNVDAFFQPLPRHWKLWQDVIRMIRSGYRSRNPFEPGYELSSKDRAGGRIVIPKKTALSSGLLCGLSGLGKTFSVDRVLSFIPQVIQHVEYRPKGMEPVPFNHQQVTWLKMECPSTGSPKQFCVSFFESMDAAIGTNYKEEYSKQHIGISMLMGGLKRVALLHSLGLLVVDEVQHLCRRDISQSASGKLLSFVVELVNTLNVPVLMIGNSNALELFTAELRMARRGTGLSTPLWMRFEENNPEWDLLMEEMWRYQYLKTKTSLTKELRSEFYKHTQGIPDFAVKLYREVQKHLINAGGSEVITSAVVSNVADNILTGNALIRALREHDYRVLREIEDVHPVDLFGLGSLQARGGWPKVNTGKIASEERAAKLSAKMVEKQMQFPEAA